MMMEKQIHVSTQGRLTIPKHLRDELRIQDGQPVIIYANKQERKIVISLLPTIPDYK